MRDGGALDCQPFNNLTIEQFNSFDPTEVSGVLLTNKKLSGLPKSPSIMDVIPTVLGIFNIPISKR